MIPLSTVLSRIRTLYEAETGDGTTNRWSDSDLTTMVNEALECLAEGTGFYERYCSIPIEADRRYYDLRGFTPDSVSRVKSVWSSVRNEWLSPKTIQDLGDDWEDPTGDPYVFFTRGANWLGVYPVPTSTVGYLRVYFAGIPSRFTHTQAVLGDLPDQYYPAIEEYVLYELAGMDGRTEASIDHFKRYLAREKSLGDYLDRRRVGSTAGAFGRLAGRLGG